MVLVIITESLIVRETEIIELLAESVTKSSLTMKEESCDFFPKSSVIVCLLVFIRARIVNLVGTKSYLLEVLYRLFGQTTLIEYADNSALCIHRHSRSPLCKLTHSRGYSRKGTYLYHAGGGDKDTLNRIRIIISQYG